MTNFKAVVWPATILAITVIAALTLLLATGHQQQAQWAVIVVANGIAAGVNLWIGRRGEHKVESVQEQVTGPSNEDLEATLAKHAAALVAIQKRLGIQPTLHAEV